MKELLYVNDYFQENQVHILEKEIIWDNVQFARGECFMAEKELNYQYILNGPVYKSIPFHSMVKTIMDKINLDFGYELNVCFLNYYIDQTKALGWHSDDSVPIDQTQPIAVVSLGEKREIWTKPIEFTGVIPQEWRQKLSDGSLFVMPAGFQDTHKHKIPKGDKKMGSRISLTFRKWKDNF